VSEIQFQRYGDSGEVEILLDGQKAGLLSAAQWAAVVVSVAETRHLDDTTGLLAAAGDLHRGVPAGVEFACAMRAPVAGDPSRHAEGIQATQTPEDARTLAGIINGRDDGTEGKPVRRSVFAWVDA
jgi:hypothetical protein